MNKRLEWLMRQADRLRDPPSRQRLIASRAERVGARLQRCMVGRVVGAWDWYVANRDNVAPLLAPLGSIVVGMGTVIIGGLVAWAALRQARTATRVAAVANQQAEIANRQADIARQRHEEQTRSDRQRRITDTFSKAVEQLGSEKMEVRIGGIYTLERLARDAPASPQLATGATEESADAVSELYWTVMETLTAFVRERPRGSEEDLSAYDSLSGVLATDIAAVLEVIRRRPDAGRGLEKQRRWRLDLRACDLRVAYLIQAHLPRARFMEANLKRADLRGANLEGADLTLADLEGAQLWLVNLKGAKLMGAHLWRRRVSL